MHSYLSRRKFCKSLLASSILLTNGSALGDLIPLAETTTITILHTNDTHSQLEPFPAGTRNAGMGGVARRATLVKRIRGENPNTLVVDAGDTFQGTPYYNFYHGELEIKALSAIGYDAVTLGNHDFDDGVESLVRALKHANFQIVSANYDVSQSPLQAIVKPYVVRNLSGIKVGIFGMGIDFNGLVVEKNHIGVKYLDPFESARKVVTALRDEEKVDLIIALSHLGYKYEKEPDRPSDLRLATALPDINFIVGGHTHTFMKEPDVIKHANGKQTLLFQVGYGGINVGRVDFVFAAKQLVSWRAALIDGVV